MAYLSCITPSVHSRNVNFIPCDESKALWYWQIVHTQNHWSFIVKLSLQLSIRAGFCPSVPFCECILSCWSQMLFPLNWDDTCNCTFHVNHTGQPSERQSTDTNNVSNIQPTIIIFHPSKLALPCLAACSQGNPIHYEFILCLLWQPVSHVWIKVTKKWLKRWRKANLHHLMDN